MAAALLLMGCAGADDGPAEAPPGGQVPFDKQLLVVTPDPPGIAAEAVRDIARAARAAERAAATPPRTPPARRVGAGALGWLTATAQGREFLMAETPRAIARGEPAGRCPAAAVAGSASGVGAAANQALAACHAALPTDRPDCGCRLVAIDDRVLVPIADLAHARGISARMSLPDTGRETLLVAEDAPDGAVLRDATGPVGRYLRVGRDGARVLLLGRGAFEGRRIVEGFRRGRLAERIYASGPDGARLVLLIGFGPKELAETAGAWLAWPG